MTYYLCMQWTQVCSIWTSAFLHSAASSWTHDNDNSMWYVHITFILHTI